MLGLGLPIGGLSMPAGSLPVPTTIEGISAPVEISAPVPMPVAKTIAIEDYPVGTIPLGGSVTDGLKSLAKGLGKMIDPMTLMALTKGAGSLFGQNTQTAPTTATSQADGKSGDINQTVSFGDFVVKGMKFDLASIPAWVWATVAVSGGIGLIAYLKANKGKK